MQMESNSTVSKEDEQMELPPGFRFHPTDEELITHYLAEKVLDNNLTTIAIGEADLNKIEPWDLPRQAKMGEKEWYFFVVRDRKYPTGLRTNRATEAGYWKATGKDKEIYKAKVLVGMKKTLVFYTGRAPKGAKTNWVMHEYRLEGKYSKLPKNTKNDWVISRIFNKSSSAKKSDVAEMVYAQDLHSSFLPPLMDSSPSNKCDPKSVTLQDLHPSFLPPLMDSSPNKSEPSSAITSNPSHVTCFSNLRMLDHQFPATKQEEIGMFGTSTSTNLTTPSSSLFPYSKSSLSSLLSEHDMPDFDFADSFLTQDQSMLKLLLEGKGTTPNSSEIPAIDGLSGFPNQYITNNLTTPIEHNSFWDY